MGYYAERKDLAPRNKAQGIASENGGEIVTQEAARRALEEGRGVYCVVTNPGLGFEAAGFCHDMREFEAFTRPSDPRPKQFVVMDRKRAEGLCRFRAVVEYAP